MIHLFQSGSALKDLWQDIFEILVRLALYLQARGAGPFCGFHKLLGYCLSGLDLFECSPMKHTKSRSPQSKSSGSGRAKPGGGSALLGSAQPLGTSSMCTFQTRLALGGLAKLSAKLSAKPMLGQLVSSVVRLGFATLPSTCSYRPFQWTSLSQDMFYSQVCPRMMVILPMPVEGGSFQVISILDHEVNDFGDVASIIEGDIGCGKFLI